MLLSVTVPYRYAIPVLQGKGLTLDGARRTLREARTKGFTSASQDPRFPVVILYENRKYTIR